METAVMEVKLTLLWSLLFHCWQHPLTMAARRAGQCTEPPSNTSTIEQMCSSSAAYPHQQQQSGGAMSKKEWHLYPVDYEPFLGDGLMRDTFFRTGGIDWRCMDLVVSCANRTRLLLNLRCRNASAIYAVDQVRSKHQSYQDGGRCCAMSLQLRPGIRVLDRLGGRCNNQDQDGYELWGDASQLLLVQVCHTLLHVSGHVQGHWLFVAQDGDVAEIKQSLALLLRHYPFLRLHSWTTSLANKEACGCDAFEKYIVQRMSCNAPMYDPISTGGLRMDMALRPVSTKTIQIVVPMAVFRTVQGLILLNGVFWMCAFALRRNTELEL